MQFTPPPLGAGNIILKGEKMNTQNLVDILSQIQGRIRTHILISESRKKRFDRSLQEAQESYSSLEVPEAFEDLYESLVKKGNELIRELKKNKNSKELTDKTAYYIRYVQASVYDFKGNIRGLTYYTRMFMATAALFMALTPQFYGFVLPVVFILPIFAGLKGIKRRSLNGFMLTMAVIPMALMSGITWVRYFLQAIMSNFEQSVTSAANAWGVPPGTAQLLIIIPSILGVVLIGIALYTAYLGYKYRKMFV